MNHSEKLTTNVKVLATDLDGTLIPLAGNAQNQADLVELQQFLKENEIELVFVTGRHFASVQNAIAENKLPSPDWIICDVGTTIMHRQSNSMMEVLEAYQAELAQITRGLPVDELSGELESVVGIRKQEAEKQGPFKLSYYADAENLPQVADGVHRVLDRLAAPYSSIISVDPFNGDGLVDLLPAGVSKAFALHWWSRYGKVDQQAIVFAGDSGNDLAALTAGYRAIVVENASDEVKAKARSAHDDAKWGNRLYIATQKATSGVLEGIQVMNHR
ncbi:Mannosylfructose-phosphate phosphatase [Novipirellula aureliae]|uniref:Mannosylfructose-phosphate phosphatase n=1 Tax=Novipirellula aureliae TaxID=2527966 RepID=A0A5C6E1C2_9BACT|nr:HAD-IIB family hydrolase [Novipirellula aureliae]TWU41166.1 Mannosylfructose-phosphate phosphatase [Novipirellula aureliae]